MCLLKGWEGEVRDILFVTILFDKVALTTMTMTGTDKSEWTWPLVYKVIGRVAYTGGFHLPVHVMYHGILFSLSVSTGRPGCTILV